MGRGRQSITGLTYSDKQESGENPHRHRENIQTSHKGPGRSYSSNPEASCCEATTLRYRTSILPVNIGLSEIYWPAYMLSDMNTKMQKKMVGVIEKLFIQQSSIVYYTLSIVYRTCHRERIAATPTIRL